MPISTFIHVLYLNHIFRIFKFIQEKSKNIFYEKKNIRKKITESTNVGLRIFLALKLSY